tara:strand:+ start:881 stop:1312 length:432 start_codon:yes stop_codon:yes gene_type:complete
MEGYNISLTLSPISPKSIKNYNEQQERIRNNQPHIWTDSMTNSSKENDLFAYIINPKKYDKYGKISIYKIIKILEPKYSLEHWNNQTRNVLTLSNHPIYKGNAVDLFKTLGYNDNYHQQNTMKVSNQKKNPSKIILNQYLKNN